MPFHATFIYTGAPLSLRVEFRPRASNLSWNGDNCVSSFQQSHLMKLRSHLAMKTELRHLEQWRNEARAVISQSGTLSAIRKHIVKQLHAPLHWYQFSFSSKDVIVSHNSFMLFWFFSCWCFCYSYTKMFCYCIWLWYDSIRRCWLNDTVSVTLWSSTLQKLLV